jgi:uncharacterized protein
MALVMPGRNITASSRWPRQDSWYDCTTIAAPATAGGEPRNDVNPWQQITDWRRAASYLEDRPDVEENRIGLSGTSYAGGHAVVLGATDRRLKAVVAQVPTIDRYPSGLRRLPPDAVANLEALFAADERAQLHGERPATMAIVSDGSGKPASYSAADAVSFYLRPVPAGIWENKVTLRSTRWARMYAPGDFIERVSPTPLPMVIADHDHVDRSHRPRAQGIRAWA